MWSPGLAKYRPMKTHENILLFAKTPGGTYNPIMEKGEPFKRQSKNPEGYVSKRNDHGYGLKPVKVLKTKAQDILSQSLTYQETSLHNNKYILHKNLFLYWNG